MTMNFKTNFVREYDWIQQARESDKRWDFVYFDQFNDAIVSSDAMTSYVTMIVEE
jgi:hypothetical protein